MVIPRVLRECEKYNEDEYKTCALNSIQNVIIQRRICAVGESHFEGVGVFSYSKKHRQRKENGAG